MSIWIIFIILLIIICITGIVTGYYFSLIIARPICRSYEETYYCTKGREPKVIETYNKLKKEKVSIDSVYGYKLNGIFFPNRKVDKVVILSHGVTSNLWNMLKYGFAYIPKGFSILAYDHRYHGLSEGKSVSYGYYEKYDLKACVDWLRNRYGNNIKIGLHGESMGSAIIIEYLGLYDDVEFCVDTCGYTDFREEAKFILRQDFNIKLDIIQNYIIIFSSIINKIKYGWSFKQVSPIKSIKNTKTPLLLIHGREDTVVPFDMCEKIFNAKKYGIKDKYEVKKAKHTTTLDSDEKSYIDHLYRFLESVGI
ncbi:alpha/beta hydrolase [Clostridium sp. CCUG 7971]|uniref:alpha/beta hydrolase n=1 Tax=Clostridium sp. CCUG 7971 TaxID=2811414 RepID=UPI001ABA366C|nr:alpha/beta hydrolase [Clostridium sp. CCUG 7971]MBO3444627.1 alpha/beta hydrolase [Clostridium sp. CCUG 7971]